MGASSLGSPAARADWVIQWEVLSSAPVNGRGHWALSALTLFGVGARPRGGTAMCLRSQAVGGRCGAPSWPPKPKACCSWWYSRRQVRFPTLPLKDEEPGFPWAPRGQQAIRGARSAAARTCLWPQELGAPDSTVGIRAELLPESRGARSPPLCPPPIGEGSRQAAHPCGALTDIPRAQRGGGAGLPTLQMGKLSPTPSQRPTQAGLPSGAITW